MTRKLVATVFAVLSAMTFVTVGAWSDPADPVAELRALARQSEETEEAKHQVQIDLNAAMAARAQAQLRLADDQDKEAKSKAVIDQYQGVVDLVVESAYNGVRLNELYALLVSKSPGQLLDQMSDIKAIASDVQGKVDAYKKAYASAQKAAGETQQALDAAKAAEQRSLAKKAELQAKEAQLQQQIAAVKSKYLELTPTQIHDFSVNPMQDAAPAPAEAPAPEQVFPDAAPESIPAPQDAPRPKKDQDVPLPPETSEGPGGVIEGTKARAVQAALSKVGRPYVWGGSGPTVFDCSGLVMWAYQQTGRSLPHSSQAQGNIGRHVSRGDLQPGDVITFYGGASHVALYIGNGLVVHAPTYGQPVVVVPIDAAGPVHDMRRY